MKIPQTIFGLGGAGKEILFTLLEQEWFLKTLVKYKKDGTIDRLQAVIVDTATAEYPNDVKRRDEILKRLEELLIAEEEHISSTDLLDIRVICIPKIVNVNRVSDLIARDVVSKIKNSDALKYDFGVEDIVWWLEDERLGDGWFSALKTIDPKIDVEFAKGVFRKRAISKSLFYKYIAEGLEDFPNIRANEPCAIIVGLGGGTGSGIFLDLAMYLKRKGIPVDLFAVLPTSNELDDEKSNAFVALSEIEYLRVKGISPFAYVILLPFDKTEFVVSRAQDPRIKENVRQFDTVASYIFANFYIGAEIGGADIFSKLLERSYSNLMMATGVILRYDIESLHIIKDLIYNLISEIKKFHEILKDRNEKLLSMLKELENIYGKDDKVPSKPSFDYLRSLVESLEICNNRVFKLMRYSSTEKIVDELEYKRENLGLNEIKTFDDLIKYINIYLEVLDNVKRRSDLEPKDSIDRELPDVLYNIFTELRNTGEIIKLYTDIRLDEKIRTTIESLVKGVPLSHSNEVELGNYIQSKRDEISKIENKIKEILNEIDDLKHEEKQIRAEVSEFIDRIRHDLSGIWETSQLTAEFKRKIRELNNDLNDFIGKIVDNIRKYESSEPKKLYTGKKDRWLDTIGYNETKENIHRTFAQLGFHEENLENEVNRFITKILNLLYCYSLSKYYEFREKECSKSKNPFTRRKAKKFKELKDNFHAESDKAKSELFDEEFSVEYAGALPESVDITSAIIRRFEKKIENQTDDIVNEINRKFGLNITEEAILKALEKDRKSEYIDEIQSEITEKVIEKKRLNEKIRKLENELRKFEEELNKAKMSYEILMNFWNKYLEIKDGISDYSTMLDNIRTHLENLNRKTEEREKWKEDYIYLSKLYPDSRIIGAIEDSKSLDINKILKSNIVEKEIIRREIKRIVDKCKVRIGEIASDKKYHGIGHLPIEKRSNGIIRWSPSMVRLCLNGGEEIISKVTENEDVLIDYINSGLALTDRKSVKILASTEVYSPFDIAILLFIAPMFLDNIANVSGDDGYYKSYTRSKGIKIAGKFIPNILHHTLSLECGKVIRRTLVDLMDAVEITYKEDIGSDVSNDVLKYYEVTSLVG